MAVRNVVRHLPDRPAARPIRCIELLRRQTPNCGSDLSRGGLDLVDPLVKIAITLELSDRITQGFHSGSALLRFALEQSKREAVGFGRDRDVLTAILFKSYWRRIQRVPHVEVPDVLACARIQRDEVA